MFLASISDYLNVFSMYMIKILTQLKNLNFCFYKQTYNTWKVFFSIKKINSLKTISKRFLKQTRKDAN